ncbi:hypothetical protein MQX03_12070 [Chryseobacterium aahli]|uniref:hypothetical protein n=1 Tax=Chryseobacterium aahli TaxID=1278643 RepID=UPI001F612AB1|nr:hypothetical protein [Chryseobacterium aahli]MCI3937940.1 hypothetical protein [Chryseobacterium aahli]
MTENKIYNLFFEKLEPIFNVEKLTKDLFSYINQNNDSQSYFLSSSHEISGSIKNHEIKNHDSIVISDIYITKKYHEQIFLPFQVNIIIGDFDTKLGYILTEKFRAEMMYNYDYELITIDFFHNIK